MKSTRRTKKDVVASVSPDTSLIEEQNMSLKSARSVAIIGEEDDDEENDQMSSQKENQESLKSKPSTPVKKNANVPTVTPQKPEEQKSAKSPRKGPFGRKITEEDCAVVKAAVDVPNLVKIVYSKIRVSTGALGGNGATGAIYGELTMHSMQKIINYMVENCELTSKSRFIDIGAGLGKPNLHVAQDPCCRLSLGIELETIRWQLSMKNLSDISKTMCDNAGVQDMTAATGDLKLHSGANFLGMDIDDAVTLNPLTHIYQYDLGFPPPLQQSIAKKFNSSCYAMYFISYRPPDRVTGEYGYEVTFMGQLVTAMHGSGENHTVYFYKRLHPLCVPPLGAQKVRIPKRVGFEEEDEEVVCDSAFESAIKLAVGPVKDLHAHALQTIESYLNSSRPTRERKPRVYYE